MSDLSQQRDPSPSTYERDLRDVASEQAALRRVATLVAGQATPAEVFATVAREAAQTLHVAMVSIVRYEPHRMAAQVGAWGVDSLFALGTRWPLDETSVSARVFASGAPARVDEYADVPGGIAGGLAGAGIHTAVGAPIVVEGVLWGLVMALSTERMPLPSDTEERLTRFTDLVAMAIANAQARDDLHQLADEQAALRRVAMLVARQASPRQVFDAVAQELAHVLDLPSAGLMRYEPDGTAVLIGAWGASNPYPIGYRWPPHPGVVASVLATGEPARVDDYAALPDPVSGENVAYGIRSGIGAPVIVDGRRWGVVMTVGPEPLPGGMEHRLAAFTELVATAISNATNHAQLVSSRARIVTAGDEARRRIERDLHDGTQQRLVSIGLELEGLKSAIGDDAGALCAEVSRIQDEVTSVMEDVREISRGLHPALLSQAGLAASLRSLARKSPVPADLYVQLPERLPQSLEIATYYVVSEALANATKHASPSGVAVRVEVAGGRLRATISDDGVGGADVRRGSGLIGLADRVEALGGSFSLVSPKGEGTVVSVDLPVELEPQVDDLGDG